MSSLQVKVQFAKTLYCGWFQFDSGDQVLKKTRAPEFATCDFEKTKVPEQANGVIMFNPEYGERMGDEIELNATYARMGDFLKNQCKGYTGYVFTCNLDIAKKIRLKPSRKIEFFNATIDCRLLEYELYAGTKREDKKTVDQ